MIASAVESQSTAGLVTTITPVVSADTSDLPPTETLARQPPIGIETAAATNPTQVTVKPGASTVASVFIVAGPPMSFDDNALR